jgi:Tfp pilus assembly protein PilV
METIVALFIFSLVLMTLFNIFPNSIVATHRSQEAGTADSLADSILEQYRARPFSQLTPEEVTLDPVERAGVTYTPMVRVTIPSPDSSVRTVRVTVQAQEGNATRQTVRERDISEVTNGAQ